MSEQAQGRPRPAARRRARQMCLQGLYQWQMSGNAISAIEASLRADNDMSKVDSAYFHELLHGIPAQVARLDETIEPLLDRKLNELDPVEKAALRIGVFELLQRVDVPYRVVINEAIELAKRYGAAESHRYVNGILDKLAPTLRAAEVAAYRNKKR